MFFFTIDIRWNPNILPARDLDTNHTRHKDRHRWLKWPYLHLLLYFKLKFYVGCCKERTQRVQQVPLIHIYLDFSPSETLVSANVVACVFSRNELLDLHFAARIYDVMFCCVVVPNLFFMYPLGFTVWFIVNSLWGVLGCLLTSCLCWRFPCW